MNERLKCLSDERLLEIEQRLTHQKKRLITEITRLQLISKCYQQLNQNDTNHQQLKRNLIVLKSLKSCDTVLTRINQNQDVMDITGVNQINECHEIDGEIETKDLTENIGCDSTNNCVETETNANTKTNPKRNFVNYNNLSVTQLVYDAISSADQSIIDNNSQISIANNKYGVNVTDLNNNETKQKQTITNYSATDEIIVESILEKWLNENKTNTENSRPSLKWRPKNIGYYGKKRKQTIKGLIGKANRIKSAIK